MAKTKTSLRNKIATGMIYGGIALMAVGMGGAIKTGRLLYDLPSNSPAVVRQVEDLTDTLDYFNQVNQKSKTKLETAKTLELPLESTEVYKTLEALTNEASSNPITARLQLEKQRLESKPEYQEFIEEKSKCHNYGFYSYYAFIAGMFSITTGFILKRFNPPQPHSSL